MRIDRIWTQGARAQDGERTHGHERRPTLLPDVVDLSTLTINGVASDHPVPFAPGSASVPTLGDITTMFTWQVG